MNNKTIGKVELTYLQDITTNKYVDSAEKFLFNFFEEKPESKRKKDIYKILSNNPSWDIFYNLHPQRRHILDWYEFNKNSNLLDIGAGTGAVTGLFLDKLSNVTALELTQTRAEILAHRFSDYSNLEVFAGNIDQFTLKKKYDYVNLTGVLEYGGMFSTKKSHFSEAHKYILSKCHSFLKKEGKIFVAIENPLGVRYLTGAVEDHYGELFEGLENYPQYNGIRTYTKTELKKILIEEGFKNLEIYTLFPDYKLPILVIHEDYLDNYDQLSLSSFIQNIDYAHPLFKFYSEVLFSSQLSKEKLLSTFANSFLIVAEKI